ncbi:MAG TPA: COX15/CtaA family protein [Bryobacteraceae bacterium]|nr:COX15/CtaA family protein [Bryobacteraceae bacterium]
MTWLERYAVLVAFCTLLLIIAGALVTSNDAALSIPDWPLSYGRLIPPWEGGIRLEFTHRVLAATVALLTLVLALWLRHRLAWAAFGTVLVQALLGGAVVKLVDPKSLAIAHACLAQLTFGILVTIPASTRHGAGTTAGRAETRLGTCRVSALAALALFLQTALGAAVRHNTLSVIPHIAGAAISTTLVMWAGLRVFIQHLENALLRRSATTLLALTFLQVFLGFAAYTMRIASADAAQPDSITAAFTVAHVAAGSLAFGAAVVLALVVYRDARPSNGVLAPGGMAAA